MLGGSGTVRICKCTITSQVSYSQTTKAPLHNPFHLHLYILTPLGHWNLDPLTSLEGFCRPYKYEDGLHLTVHVCGGCSEDIGG